MCRCYVSVLCVGVMCQCYVLVSCVRVICRCHVSVSCVDGTRYMCRGRWVVCHASVPVSAMCACDVSVSCIGVGGSCVRVMRWCHVCVGIMYRCDVSV